jgi:hypothetical protein
VGGPFKLRDTKEGGSMDKEPREIPLAPYSGVCSVYDGMGVHVPNWACTMDWGDMIDDTFKDNVRKSPRLARILTARDDIPAQ